MDRKQAGKYRKDRQTRKTEKEWTREKRKGGKFKTGNKQESTEEWTGDKR